MPKFLMPIIMAATLAPVSVSAQSLPPYAQPDPSTTRAAPAPGPAASAPPIDPAVEARARDWLRRAQTGDFDRSQMEPELSKAVTPQGAKEAAAGLAALGKYTAFAYVDTVPAGQGLKTYVFRVTFPSRTMNWFFTVDDAGKVAGIYLHPEEAPVDPGTPPHA